MKSLLCKLIGHYFKNKYPVGGSYTTEYCVRCGKRNS